MKENLFRPVIEINLTGEQGNIYTVLGFADNALRQAFGAKARKQINEMWRRVKWAKSYDSALQIIGEYVTIKSIISDRLSYEENFDA